MGQAQSKSPSPAPEGAAAPAKKPEYRMPKPTSVVIWSHVPGGERHNAVVTGIGKQAISVLVFPVDSRGGVVREAVRHVDDPQVKRMVSPDAGVWDYPDEMKVLFAHARSQIGNAKGDVEIVPDDAVKALHTFAK